MKTTVGKVILAAAALVLGIARVPLWPAILVWLASAGIVFAIGRLRQKS